jgi:hypothetical protein
VSVGGDSQGGHWTTEVKSGNNSQQKRRTVTLPPSVRTTLCVCTLELDVLAGISVVIGVTSVGDTGTSVGSCLEITQSGGSHLSRSPLTGHWRELRDEQRTNTGVTHAIDDSTPPSIEVGRDVWWQFRSGAVANTKVPKNCGLRRSRPARGSTSLAQAPTAQGNRLTTSDYYSSFNR